MSNVDTRFLDAYLECAIWADLRDENGEPIEGYTIFDFATVDRDAAREECADFMAQASELLAAGEWTMEQAGHDFWLTRNGHGAGFWDRGKSQGAELTRIAKSYSGGKYVVVGDDGKLHFEG